MEWINSHTHLLSAPAPKIFVITELDKITDEHVQDKFCLGLHPWFIQQYSIQLLESQLEKYHRHANFVAIGEIGLDRTREDLALQKKIFKAQVQLAKKYQISRMVLHNIGLLGDMLSILKQCQYKGALMWHGLNPSSQEIETLLQLPNLQFIGIGSLIFTPAKISRTLREIPQEMLLMETDDQQGLDIQAVYSKASELLEMDITQLQSQIQKNFNAFVNFSDDLA